MQSEYILPARNLHPVSKSVSIGNLTGNVSESHKKRTQIRLFMQSTGEYSNQKLIYAQVCPG